MPEIHKVSTLVTKLSALTRFTPRHSKEMILKLARNFNFNLSTNEIYALSSLVPERCSKKDPKVVAAPTTSHFEFSSR